MPRAIDKDLLDCLRRANPLVEYRVEISTPDVGQVLRRSDQFTAAVSMTPALSLSASPRGPLALTPTTVALANFTGVGSSYDLNGEAETRRVKGLAWKLDAAFNRATLKSIQARIQRVAIAGFFFPADFELQVFKITKTPGVKQSNVGTPQYQSTVWTEYSFAPLLNPAPVIKYGSVSWDGSNNATLTFDVANWGLVLDNSLVRAASPDQTGELPEYLIVVRLTGKVPAGTGHYRWYLDTVASRTIAGVGTFERVWWARENDQEQWVRTAYADVPSVTVNFDAYPATGSAIYLIDQGAAPKSASSGRIVFERAVPPGTTATLELSTAGSGGPWTVVKHGDPVTVKQQTYHVRVTENADTALKATPLVNAMGVEFRIPRDVSLEAIPQLPTREVEMPYGKASIPEGKIRVVKTGVKDYLDVATVIGSSDPASRLEADIFMASRHPSITRDKWLRLERMMVTNRMPSATSEEFTLLSYASRLKRKIPAKVESLNSVHTVQAGSTASQLIVLPVLPGTTGGGNEYDGKNYYMRVRTTAAPNTAVGYVQTIQGNTSTDRLDFTPALSEALVTGDVIEVHSGIFNTQTVSWIDYDPADVWWEVLTTHLAIPPERIGAGYLPRGGKPPKVTDRAPGDATTQSKLKVTGRISEQEAADEILDQLSAIMGGVTMEIDGQIVFIQLLPLRNAAGEVTVPLPPSVATFDARDIVSLQTPPGLEKRSTILSANYGVPATASDPDAFPSRTTTATDSDALLWLAQQDLEDLGTAEVAKEITRWFYNSTDAGLYLASVFNAQVVKATSTGLRIFPMVLSEKYPELLPGDVVVIHTSQYTDYDPSTQTSLKGPLAIRGVIVRLGGEGRQLGVFIPGLAENVTQVNGGAAGLLTGLGSQPAAPILSASFDATGQLIINSSGDFATASQKIAWATGSAPSLATVRAATPIAQQNVSGLATGSVYPAGTTVFIAAFAYSANGLESTPLAVISVTREGSGTSAPPVPAIVPLNTESDETTVDLRFSAVAGSGGGGTNLTYTIKEKKGFLAETTLYSGNATTLPRDASIARNPRFAKVIRFTVTDTATGLAATAVMTIASQRPEVNDTGNPFRNRPFDDGKFAPRAADTSGWQIDTGVTDYGSRLIQRFLAKPLVADPDDADPIPAGVLKRIPKVGGMDGSGNLDLSGTAWVNRHLGNVSDDATSDRRSATANQKTGGDRAAAAIDSGNVIITTGIDFSRLYTGKNAANLPRTSGDTTAISAIVGHLANTGHAAATFQESGGKVVNRLFAKPLAGDADNLDSVGNGTTYSRPLASRISAGKPLIDFSEAINLNKNQDNVGDGSTYARVQAGQLSGNRVQKLTSVDVRATNELPSFYQMGQTVEFKQRATIGAPGATTYGQLTTDKPWADASGGEATQTFRSVDGAFKRESSGMSAWGSWRYIIEATTQRIGRNDGHLDSTMQESGTKLVNRLLAKTLAADADNFDGLPEGTVTYRKTTTNQRDGGGRGFSALDASNKLITGITSGAMYADGSTGIDARKPAEAGANVTETRTAADTAAVAGTAAATVQSGAARGQGGFTNATGGLVSTATESGAKAVNRLFAKTLAADADTLDSAPDGTTYKKILGVTSGLVRAASLGALAVTNAAVNDMAAGKMTAGNMVTGIAESSGRLVNRLFAKDLFSDPDNIDSTPDGTTYRKTTTNQRDGGGRAFSGLAADGDLVGNIDGDTEVQAGDLYVESTKRVKVGTSGTPGTLPRRLRISFAELLPYSDTEQYQFNSGGGYVHPRTVGVTLSLVGAISLPHGAKIESFQVRLFRNDTNDTARAWLQKTDGVTLTNICNLMMSTSGAWITLEDTAPSETVDNGSNIVYFIEVSLTTNAGSAATESRFAWAEVEYTIPDLGVGF